MSLVEEKTRPAAEQMVPAAHEPDLERQDHSAATVGSVSSARGDRMRVRSAASDPASPVFSAQ